jgi:DNA-binding SARP family transcriptional activator
LNHDCTVYDLFTLGGIDLRGTRGAEPLLTQPKRFALLVYLALARPRGVHRRSALLPLFWPDLRGGRARSALRQALHGLRRALGADVVHSRGDEDVWLDRSVLRCDAVRFEALLAEGAPAEAIGVYAGPLLPGFVVEGAVGFDRWLEDERERLRTLAVGAAWRLAAAAGPSDTAVGWARLAVHHSEHDECSYRRLIALLAQLGDRAGAVATYLQLCRRLAHDFSCAPSPETESLLRSIRAARVPPALAAAPRSRPVTLP